MSIESYKPSQEEVTRAESMMTDEQRAMSEKREEELALKNPENATELQNELKSLELANQQSFDEVVTGYEKLIGEIDAQLKDPVLTAEMKKGLVVQKKEHQGKIQELQTKYPEFASAEAKKEQDQKAQELIDRIPEEFYKQQFSQLIQDIPEKFRSKYIKTLEGSLGNRDEVMARTTVRGLVFELSRIHTLLKQGLEQVDFNLETPQEIEYLGFGKNGKDFSHEPNQKLKSPIEFDVPISRNGEPYVYEAKSYPRMQFGSLATQRNQLLKYQAAIEQGVVEGATLEIKGRIDPDFLKWAAGTNVAETGRIPDVEIVYTFDLPSGAEYRFVLKRSRKNNGLDFQNEGRSNTPEATLRKIKESQPDHYEEMIRKFGNEEGVLTKLDEDRKIINGIQQSVLDRSIIDIITKVDIENSPTELQPHLDNPMTIKSADLFDQYENLRKESIYKKLLAKREIINVENKRSSYSEFATRDYVEKSLREYQDYLQQNPEMARIKKAYILNSEEDMQAVADKVMAAVEKVRNFELQRMEAEQSADNNARETRARLGYVGLPEGVALDIEHITIDAIQEVNKRKGQTGRSYENPERFNDVEALKDYLPGQDRRYLEIAIYDPVSGKTERNIDVNDTHIKRTETEILKENIKRAEEKVREMETRLGVLKGQPERTTDEDHELRVITARLKARSMHNGGIERVKQEIEVLRSEKAEKVRAEKNNANKKTIALEFDDRIFHNMERLAGLYTEVMGGEKEWDKIAKRISEKIDQNIIKFIYAVNSEGRVIVGEEVVRGDVSGRAAHSELAQGRNVYGAGELAFSKDTNGEWALSEINNGSGHYRPSVLTLQYVKNLLKLKGIDTEKVEIRDTLLRGTPPPDLTLLEE